MTTELTGSWVEVAPVFVAPSGPPYFHPWSAVVDAGSLVYGSARESTVLFGTGWLGGEELFAGFPPIARDRGLPPLPSFTGCRPRTPLQGRDPERSGPARR